MFVPFRQIRLLSEQPKVVSEHLGHASIGITLDLYSHVLPSMDEQAATTVAALVDGTG